MTTTDLVEWLNSFARNASKHYRGFESKMISNDQELTQSDPTSCPQNQKGNNSIHKLTAVYERHSQ